jgi:hypothetical protein
VQVREVSVALFQVEAVADEELVRDREADVADREVFDQPAVGAVEEGCGRQRGRAPKAQRSDEEVEREARVDDVLDHEHVAVRDSGLEVLEESDAAAAAVGRELEEVQLVRDLERSGEVGQEDEARLQRCDEDRDDVDVVTRDLRRELADAAADLLAREVDLADASRRYDASSSLYRSARRSMSRL